MLYDWITDITPLGRVQESANNAHTRHVDNLIRMWPNRTDAYRTAGVATTLSHDGRTLGVFRTRITLFPNGNNGSCLPDVSHKFYYGINLILIERARAWLVGGVCAHPCHSIYVCDCVCASVYTAIIHPDYYATHPAAALRGFHTWLCVNSIHDWLMAAMVLLEYLGKRFPRFPHASPGVFDASGRHAAVWSDVVSPQNIMAAEEMLPSSGLRCVNMWYSSHTWPVVVSRGWPYWWILVCTT